MSVYNQTETSLIVLFHLLWFSVGLYLSQNSQRYLYKLCFCKTFVLDDCRKLFPKLWNFGWNGPYPKVFGPHLFTSEKDNIW